MQLTNSIVEDADRDANLNNYEGQVCVKCGCGTWHKLRGDIFYCVRCYQLFVGVLKLKETKLNDEVYKFLPRR